MIHNIKKIIMFCCCILGLSIQVANSSFNYTAINYTENTISTLDDEVNVNVNIRKKSNNVSTTIEYFTPTNITWTHNISSTNSKGESVYSEFDVSANYKNEDTDRYLVCYDVNDGSYTEINRHDTSKGTEQIKSLKFHFSYDDMISQSSNTAWADGWDGTLDFNNNDRLYFLYLMDDVKTFNESNKKKDGDVVRNDYLINEETITTENSTTTYRTYCRVVVKGTKEIIIGRKSSIFLFWWTYNGAFYYPLYQLRVEKITQTYGNYTDESNIEIIKVKKGSKLTQIKNTMEGYQFCGYFEDKDYSKFFDFSKPILEDTNIYLLYSEETEENLADTINDLTSGKTANIFDSYRGGSNGDIDLYTDPSYSRNTGSIFLDEATIGNGVTVNLTFGRNKIYEGSVDDAIDSAELQNSRSNSDSYLNESYDNSGEVGDKKCNTYILLNGDLKVNGTLNIGGLVGSYTNYTKYSYLIGEYSKLDLMGHDIIVDGGELNVYGVIEDSVGSGEIILQNGAKLKATVSIVDGKPIRQEILGLSKRQSPFTQYFFPYLRVPVYISNGCSFTAYCKFEMGEFGIDNILLNLFGASDSLFMWGDQNANSYVYFEPYYIDSIPNSETTLIRQLYNIRNRFLVNANIIETNALNLSITAVFAGENINIELDFLRLDVPISSFFDLIIENNYNLTLNSTLFFYPGSSLYVKDKATITFNYKSNESTYFPDMGYSWAGLGIKVPGESRYICGGIVNYTNRISDLSSNGPNNYVYGILNTANYWKYVKYNNINIEGNLVFNSDINTNVETNDGFYILSGQIQLSDKALQSIYENKAYLKTYSIKGELVGGFLFNSDSMSIDTQCEFASAYNVNCLTSNNVSFYIDANKSIYGSFENENGLFFEDGNLGIENGHIVYNENSLNSKKTYFLFTDTDMYQNGSSDKNQYDSVDRSVQIKEVSIYNINTKIIQSDDSYYMYYCGIYVPIITDISSNTSFEFADKDTLNINAQKFCSNVDSPATNASKYNNVVVSYSSSSKCWKFKSFGT